jgi:hypothetical protein
MHHDGTTKEVGRIAYHVKAVPGTIVRENMDDFTWGEEDRVLETSSLIW